MTTRPDVLVVEDDDSIREVLYELLKDEGFTVRTATDGAQALELVHQRAPTLIFLDMRMPVMDGWTFARRFRQEIAEPRAPIVVMTAAVDAAASAREINADAVLSKPFDLDAALQIAHRLGTRIAPSDR